MRCICARWPSSATVDGIGHRAGDRHHRTRSGAPGHHRRDIGGVQRHRRVVMRAGIGGQRAPIRHRLLPRLALRRVLAALDVGERRLVRRDQPGPRAGLDRHVGHRHAPGHVERADRLAGVFDHVPGAAGGADLADDRQHDVLAPSSRSPACRRPGSPCSSPAAAAASASPSRARPRRCRCRTPARPSRHASRCASRRRRSSCPAATDAEFRADDVHDALPHIEDRDVRHAELDDVLLQRLDLDAAVLFLDVGRRARADGRDVVVGDRDGQIGPAQLAARPGAGPRRPAGWSPRAAGGGRCRECRSRPGASPRRGCPRSCRTACAASRRTWRLSPV